MRPPDLTYLVHVISARLPLLTCQSAKKFKYRKLRIDVISHFAMLRNIAVT